MSPEQRGSLIAHFMWEELEKISSTALVRAGAKAVANKLAPGMLRLGKYTIDPLRSAAGHAAMGAIPGAVIGGTTGALSSDSALRGGLGGAVLGGAMGAGMGLGAGRLAMGQLRNLRQARMASRAAEPNLHALALKQTAERFGGGAAGLERAQRVLAANPKAMQKALGAARPTAESRARSALQGSPEFERLYSPAITQGGQPAQMGNVAQDLWAAARQRAVGLMG